MNRFASGEKAHFYGKGDVTVYRLLRKSGGPAGEGGVFGASVLMLLYGGAFWKTYSEGNNTGLIATDSMKNFIQRETMNFEGIDLESYCRYLAEKFLQKYPQVDGLQVSADEILYELAGGAQSFQPGGPERAFARIELARDGLIEATSGVKGFKLLRLGGSAFKGFVRDEYTTLPDLTNRPLHMWLDLEWTYAPLDAAFNGGDVTQQVRDLVRKLFAAFESGSIQQIIYEIGREILAMSSSIAEVRLEANNRTWDTIAEADDTLGVYTDARPPYGCLGLTLKRAES